MLYLYGNKMTDNGAKKIIKALKYNNSITDVFIYGNYIGFRLIDMIDQTVNK